MQASNITIGSDPEFPAINEAGVPTSVIGFLPGTKQEPYELEQGVSCQIDCVGAETCIPPVDNKEDFIKYIRFSKELTTNKLQELAPHLSLTSLSSARYSDKDLEPGSARTFGCDPSYCVYTQEISPRPHPDAIGNLRSFGFHIHIGYKVEDSMDAIDMANRIIRSMDIQCGIPSILIDRDEDRRQIYGQAGDLRFEKLKGNNHYKVEYRTLGAFMHSSDELVGWVYDQTMKAVELANNWKEEYENMGLLVQSAIDTGNVELCTMIMNQFEIKLPNNIVHERISA